MRLDKFLSETMTASRKESARTARSGGVRVNGEAVRDVSVHIDPDTDVVEYLGVRVEYAKYHYFLLNKPEGYVSATDDRSLPCVTELLPPPYDRAGLFPVGRLDRDTVGLMILTDDGALAHALLSPKHHVQKEYFFRVAEPLADGAEDAFARGMTLGNGEECKSAALSLSPDRMSGTVTLTEGKYHQIKRMMGALGNRITYLARTRFASIRFDTALAPGQCRPLTDGEIASLRSAAGGDQT